MSKKILSLLLCMALWNMHVKNEMSRAEKWLTIKDTWRRWRAGTFKF